METAGHLRSRRTEAQWHALASVGRELRLNDQSNRRKYLREYHQAFRSYQRVLSGAEFDAAIHNADILLVGDYHALPKAQHFAAELLEKRSQPGDRSVVLGLETILSRDQHILDQWWRREIDANELRRRIRFDVEWGYDWEPVLKLLSTGRDHCEAIYGLDCMPREDLRRIGARDRHAAYKLQEIRERHPEAVILVLFGESHLAPTHLPRILRQQLPEQQILTILQNVDQLYWQAMTEGEEQVGAGQVDSDVICVFNATPLEKYEHYRLQLSRWRCAGEEHADAAPTIYNLILSLARILGIERYSARNSTQPRFLMDLLPEVCSTTPDAQIRALLGTQSSEAAVELYLRRLEEQGSVYLSDLNLFIVREFRLSAAAEEAARFLHHACQGLSLNRPVVDQERFYGEVIEYALAHFGSRILCGGREEVSEERSSLAPSGSEFAGNLLGNQLYHNYIAGRISSRRLRQIFLVKLHEPGKAKALFRELSRRRSSPAKR